MTSYAPLRTCPVVLLRQLAGVRMYLSLGGQFFSVSSVCKTSGSTHGRLNSPRGLTIKQLVPSGCCVGFINIVIGSCKIVGLSNRLRSAERGTQLMVLLSFNCHLCSDKSTDVVPQPPEL